MESDMKHNSIKCISLGIALSIGHQIPYVVANEFTFSQWIQMTNQWKRGYATAIADELTTIVNENEAPRFSSTMSYRMCFKNGVTDEAIVKLIDNYILRHPDDFSSPMVIVTIKAIREACAPYFQK